MALADILKRIDRDAESEAGALVLAAEQGANDVRAEAERHAASDRERELAHQEHEAVEEARTRLAGARLRGRDRMLSEKRALIDRVLVSAVERIEKLPPAEYATLLAREVARAARGGERVLVARADGDALVAALGTALAALDVNVTLDGTTDTIDHGLVLEGQRMRVEISPAAMAETRRGPLEARVTEILFGGDE